MNSLLVTDAWDAFLFMLSELSEHISKAFPYDSAATFAYKPAIIWSCNFIPEEK